MPNAPISVEDYDPNAPGQSHPLWFVYTGYIKAYHSRGPAVNFFRKHYRAKLFAWNPATSSWDLLATKLPHDPFCDLCGGTTMDHPRIWGGARVGMVADTSQPQRDYGSHVFMRKGRKLIDPLQLVYACRPCREGRGL